MALKYFCCPHDTDDWHSIEDCEACPTPCEPLPILRAKWRAFVGHTAAEHYHADPHSISITGVLPGACIRQTALQNLIDYAETPAALHARWVGTCIHEAIAAAGSPGYYWKEGRLPEGSEVQMSEDLGDGFTLDGTLDAVDGRFITDWKFKGFMPREGLDAVAPQLNAYMEMAGIEREPRAVAISPYEVREFALERIKGALAACRERALMVKAVQMEERPVSWLPAEGKQIKFSKGKTMCDYCPEAIRVACAAADQEGNHECDEQCSCGLSGCDRKGAD